MNTPLVSVNCLVFNHARYLRVCLDSLLMQRTNFPYEVVVHDDASTDGSSDILREYATRYPDVVRPYIQAENQHSKGRKYIGEDVNVQRSRGRYIAFCEGDDFWTDPQKLQRQFDAMEAHPACSICFHHTRVVDENGQPGMGAFPIPGTRLEGLERVSIYDLLRSHCRDGLCSFQTSSFFIRKEYMEEYVRLKQTVYKAFPYGDTPMAITALMHGEGLVLRSEMSAYRTCPTGFTAVRYDNRKQRLQMEKEESEGYRALDAYTKGIYHRLIRYKLLRNELNAASGFGSDLLVQFRPKYWRLLPTRPLRWNLSELRRGLKQKLHPKRSEDK